MFGYNYDIINVYPNYFLDYQDKRNVDDNIHWVNRVYSSSGDWSGNLFDFFFRINNYLVENVKVPFKMDGIFRVDITPIHKAVRELLCNCLSNADYNGTRGLVIKQYNDKLEFSNPGSFLIPKEIAFNGGNSDARNKLILTMFNNINVDREVRKTELSKLVKSLTDDMVESFRLSSQISVSDKYSSIISSEGFYVYLWADNNTNIPETLYMSVEFNHAGYGRTIPMMMPYFIDGVDDLTNKTSLIKTNADIIEDWQGDGYGIKKYQLYSYIKLKYLYNEENRYVYYLDTDTYGTYYDDTDVLNINLYEARITF